MKTAIARLARRVGNILRVIFCDRNPEVMRSLERVETVIHELGFENILDVIDNVEQAVREPDKRRELAVRVIEEVLERRGIHVPRSLINLLVEFALDCYKARTKK